MLRPYWWWYSWAPARGAPTRVINLPPRLTATPPSRKREIIGGRCMQRPYW